LLSSAAALRHDASHELHRIACPTLLVFGGDDPIVGRSARLELRRGIENAQVEVIPDAGHDLSLEKPNELACEIRRFLEPAALASQIRMHMSEASR
jgi:pimeloyl-ACP methyl ester carboxylesterase